jgi:hypothetical protein
MTNATTEIWKGHVDLVDGFVICIGFELWCSKLHGEERGSFELDSRRQA